MGVITLLCVWFCHWPHSLEALFHSQESLRLKSGTWAPCDGGGGGGGGYHLMDMVLVFDYTLEIWHVISNSP